MKLWKHHQPHLREKTSVIDGARRWRAFLVKEALHIHLTSQGSVFQHYLVSESQFLRNHTSLIWWAFLHCSDSSQTMCTTCHFSLMHVSSTILKNSLSVVISPPPEEGQSMMTEPFLHYSYLRYTGNCLNITPSGDIINRFAQTFLVMTVRPELHTVWTDGSIKVEGVVQMCPTYLSNNVVQNSPTI